MCRAIELPPGDGGGSGGVVVMLADGTSVEGSLLVGADGVHSRVRHHMFSSPPPGSAAVMTGAETETGAGVGTGAGAHDDSYSRPRPCGYYYWQGIGRSTAATVEAGHTHDGPVLPAYEAWADGMRFGVVALQYPYNFWFLCADRDITASGSSSSDGSHAAEDGGVKEKLIRHSSHFGLVERAS